jgi:hypothetical protein
MGPGLSGQVDVVGIAAAASQKALVFHPGCRLSKTKFHGATIFTALSVMPAPGLSVILSN